MNIYKILLKVNKPERLGWKSVWKLLGDTNIARLSPLSDWETKRYKTINYNVYVYKYGARVTIKELSTEKKSQ
jgi:hypothetical protein